ncbi:transposase [Pseudomonas sp. microsymbiont 2]
MYPTTRRNYTDEFKIQAVALAETLGRTEAARQLWKKGTDLFNWKKGTGKRGQIYLMAHQPAPKNKSVPFSQK